MRKSTIRGLIDKKIIQALDDGLSIKGACEELIVRSERFREIIRKNVPDNVDIDKLFIHNSPEYVKIDTSDEFRQYHAKVSYCIFYINHCKQRISDLDWLVKNRLRFSRYDDKKLFSLIELKEKILSENYDVNI